jgi:hypothetical protein
MGIGMVVITAPGNSSNLIKSLPGAKIVGEVRPQVAGARVMIDGVGYHKDKVE